MSNYIRYGNKILSWDCNSDTQTDTTVDDLIIITCVTYWSILTLQHGSLLTISYCTFASSLEAPNNNNCLVYVIGDWYAALPRDKNNAYKLQVRVYSVRSYQCWRLYMSSSKYKIYVFNLTHPMAQLRTPTW